MKLLPLILSCLPLLNSFGDGQPVRTAAELQSAIDRGIPDVDFDLTARLLLAPNQGSMTFIEDATGGAILNFEDPPANVELQAGDTISASGSTIRTFPNRARAIARKIAVLAHGDPPPFKAVSAKELWDDKCLLKPVKVCGLVVDAFRDEIDPNWIYFILNCQGETAYATSRVEQELPMPLTDYIGMTLSVEGVCRKLKYSNRRQITRIVTTHGLNHIKVEDPGMPDPFTAPTLEDISSLRPEDIHRIGRRCATGRVIASWGAGDALVLATDGEIIRVEVISEKRPRRGDAIDFSGFPNLHGFRLIFLKSKWRTSERECPAIEPTASVSPEDLFTNEKGQYRINANYYGRSVSVEGTVKDRPSPVTGGHRFAIDSNGFTIPVDVSALSSGELVPDVGSKVRICGTFLIETDGWKSNPLLPHATEAVLIVQDAADIDLLARPPWWTVLKLIVVIGVLCLVILSILVWNRTLRTLAERRGRELFRQQIDSATSKLRVVERTQLAVELHDSLSQVLAGVAMELEAARQFPSGAAHELLHHLESAWNTLKSCRSELRNCLWDLRSEALEEHDMETAVRMVLQPHIDGIRLAVRFAVPRLNLTDNTAHAILRIIRELTQNAIRHGKAHSLRIAGSVENGELRFSVTDDGIGFNPDLAPGVREGHFGLTGIRERVRQLNGILRIESAEGRGTKVTISVKLPKETQGNA